MPPLLTIIGNRWSRTDSEEMLAIYDKTKKLLIQGHDFKEILSANLPVFSEDYPDALNQLLADSKKKSKQVEREQKPNDRENEGIAKDVKSLLGECMKHYK